MSYLAVTALWPILEPLLPDGASFDYKRLLLGWISTESGGSINSTGDADLAEAGYFQLTGSDYSRFGLNPRDREESLKAGVSFVEEQTSKASDFLAGYGIQADEEFILKTVRLFHAEGPGLARRMFDDMRSNGSTPASFDDVSSYFGSTKGIHNDADMRARLSVGSKGFLYPSTGCYRVEKTWAEGGAIAALLELVPDVVTSIVSGPILAINSIFGDSFDLVTFALLGVLLTVAILLLRRWYRVR